MYMHVYDNIFLENSYHNTKKTTMVVYLTLTCSNCTNPSIHTSNSHLSLTHMIAMYEINDQFAPPIMSSWQLHLPQQLSSLVDGQHTLIAVHTLQVDSMTWQNNTHSCSPAPALSDRGELANSMFTYSGPTILNSLPTAFAW